MKKVLVINCGSSSLKYQLIDMETETVVAKGLAERIGIDGSRLKHQPAGKEAVIQIPRKPVSQLCRKLQRRIMSQSSQHDMREFVRLILDCFCDDRMLITVDRAPPG